MREEQSSSLLPWLSVPPSPCSPVLGGRSSQPPFGSFGRLPWRQIRCFCSPPAIARSLRVPAGQRHGLGLLSCRPRPLRQCTLPSATDRRSCAQVAPSAKGGKRLDWTCLGTEHEQDLN